jgi:hypothetical protein
VVLDSFIKTSATGGLGSIKAEVMADTAVALASGNVKLVSSKVRNAHTNTSRITSATYDGYVDTLLNNSFQNHGH